MSVPMKVTQIEPTAVGEPLSSAVLIEKPGRNRPFGSPKTETETRPGHIIYRPRVVAVIVGRVTDSCIPLLRDLHFSYKQLRRGMDKKTLTANEVSQRLGVPVKEVYRLIREGTLKGYKTKDSVRVDVEGVLYFQATKQSQMNSPA